MFRLNNPYIPRTMLIVTVLMSGVAYSQQGGSDPQDHRLLQRFPNSTVIDHQVTNSLNYQLVLGNMRRVAGRVVPERVQRLSGRLTRITYEVPQDFRGQEVFDFFQQQVGDKNFRSLFECQGRECGNSAYWANTVFENRILYGPETNQYFVAVEVPSDTAAKAYLAIYVTTRTNRRIYAHIEVLEESATSEADPLMVLLREDQSVRLQGVTFDTEDQLESPGNLAAIIDMLARDSTLKVYVVAHLRDEQGIETLLSRSERRATVVRQALIDAGIDAVRVAAFGVGPLVPDCIEGECEDRIQIVIQQPLSDP